MGATLNLNLFRHVSNDGFEYRSQLAYTPYNRYSYEGLLGTGKPTLEQFDKTAMDITSGYSTPDNSVKTIKKGVEYVLRLPRLHWLQTNVTIQGAWYRTTYGNSLPVAYRPQVVIGGKAFPYVGFYYGKEDKNTERLHTLLRTDTHLTALKLIFSSNIQIIWHRWHQDIPYSGKPAYWVDERGQQHPGETMNLANKEMKQLILPTPEYLFDRWREPLSASLNMKMTKEIGRKLKVSFFVNNLISYDPIYESNLKTKHQAWKSAFFGSEIRIKL